MKQAVTAKVNIALREDGKYAFTLKVWTPDGQMAQMVSSPRAEPNIGELITEMINKTNDDYLARIQVTLAEAEKKKAA